MIGLSYDVPVDPGPDEARNWILGELAKPGYQAAQPTLFDRIAKAISDWFSSLTVGDPGAPPTLGIAVVVTLVIVGLVVAFLIFGVPRLNRRSSVAGILFGEGDDRHSSLIRKDAEAAASRGDYEVAIEEMFRAIARGLAERSIVTTTPGTTARGFADRAAVVFSTFDDRLVESAAFFDGVRYLSQAGTYEQFLAVATLELELRTAKPQFEPVSVPVSVPVSGSVPR